MHSPLIRIVAALTKHPRYAVVAGDHFEWSSKSWTHNVFRVYELIFGRRYGIRLEMTCGIDGDGVEWAIAHSFEAAVALTETMIRSAFALPKFRFVKVYVPQLAFAGAGVPTGHPYMFAIAFDTVSHGTNNGVNTVTWSHTCTGSNLTLTTECCQNNIPTDTAGTTTYNGVTVPDVVTQTDTSSQNTYMTIGALASPATGANNVTFTTVHTNTGGFSMSLTGTSATPGGAHNNQIMGGVTSSTSISVTTTAANSWIVDNLQANATATATGTGQTKQTSFTGVGGNTFHGSTTTTTTIGSYTISYNFSSGITGDLLVAEIKALVTAVIGGNTLSMMGVG